MRKSHLTILMILTTALVLYAGKAAAQLRTYNNWDRIVFRNDPPISKRLFSLTEVNIGYGARYLDQPYEIRRTGISTMLGYRYSRAINLGIGAGIESFNGGTLAPLFVEGQIYLNRLTYGSVKPILTGSAGYMAYVSGMKTDVSMFANPSFGFLIPMSFRSSLSLTVGVYTQWALEIQRHSFINTKVGILFH